jgi:hypothetical protein
MKSRHIRVAFSEEVKPSVATFLVSQVLQNYPDFTPTAYLTSWQVQYGAAHYTVHCRLLKSCYAFFVEQEVVA